MRASSRLRVLVLSEMEDPKGPCFERYGLASAYDSVPMESSVPNYLQDERQAVEAQIREAFKGVSREGGTSWNEAWAIDLNGSDEECAAARAADNESSWEDLVDDPNWNTNACPWSFLNAIGFRYYLAPAMIRDIRKGYSDWLADALNHPIYEAELRALLTPPQFAALDRYFRFLIAVSETWSPRVSDSDDFRKIHRQWQIDGTI